MEEFGFVQCVCHIFSESKVKIQYRGNSPIVLSYIRAQNRLCKMFSVAILISLKSQFATVPINSLRYRLEVIDFVDKHVSSVLYAITQENCNGELSAVYEYLSPKCMMPLFESLGNKTYISPFSACLSPLVTFLAPFP